MKSQMLDLRRLRDKNVMQSPGDTMKLWSSSFSQEVLEALEPENRSNKN